MRAGDTRQLDSFALSIRAMTPADVPRLHELSVGVGWMHRREDWETVVALGEGIFAADEIGRVAGSAMWFPAGPDFATLGMVITTPRLQEQGAGRWMMEWILERTGERDLSLSATRAAFRLYAALGFTPGLTIFQHQGVATSAPPLRPDVRAFRAEDEAALRALDLVAFGAERRAALDKLLVQSAGTVLEREGRLEGYALCHPFGRGHVIGPVVAADQADGVALIAPHLAAHQGGFLRCDTREAQGGLRDVLEAAGLRLHDRVTTMRRGRQRQATEGCRILALATQALG